MQCSATQEDLFREDSLGTCAGCPSCEHRNKLLHSVQPDPYSFRGRGQRETSSGELEVQVRGTFPFVTEAPKSGLCVNRPRVGATFLR